MRETLSTHRLLLRDVTEDDAQLLFDLDADPEVMRYIGPWRAPDVAWVRDRIRTVYLPHQTHHCHGIRLVHERASGEFLGWVFIRPASASVNAAELGWTLPGEEEVGFRYRRTAWGRGVATEAAAPLVEIALADEATTAVVGCADSRNAGSLRVLKKLRLTRIEEVLLPGANEPTVKLRRMRRQRSSR